MSITDEPHGSDQSETGITRREFLLGISGAVMGLALTNFLSVTESKVRHSVKPTSQAKTLSTQQSSTETFLLQAAETLLDLHVTSHGGWRFESQIQAPNFQTDRDVGAASAGMGFLAMVEKYPDDSRWLNAAQQTAAWLLAVSSTDTSGGRFWHDYVNDGDIATSFYTSFDDGAIGIGDFFWQLYEQTNNSIYMTTALETVQWTFSQAKNTSSGYWWQWDMSDNTSPYYMGMGEGVVGIIHTLATYYERTSSSNPVFAARCKQYITGALQQLTAVQADLAKAVGISGDSRAIPETGIIGQEGDTEMNSGYLSGAAGAAFMYLKLYQVFKDSAYLSKADELFSWLEDSLQGPMVEFADGSVAWKLAIDPEGGNNSTFATGFEEGSAGIGWTYLQAYIVTGQRKYLTVATQAADWLLKVARQDTNGGLFWYEDENPSNPIVHANLNNGAAGIGMFFRDLYVATHDKKYQAGAQGALNWLISSAIHEGSNVFWNDNDGVNPYARDPSWHWGNAGIIEFMSRMVDGKMDIPGEQAALTRVTS